jgi:hypothetical protein
VQRDADDEAEHQRDGTKREYRDGGVHQGFRRTRPEHPEQSQVLEDVEPGVQPEDPGRGTCEKPGSFGASPDRSPDRQEGGRVVVDEVVEKVEAEQERE